MAHISTFEKNQTILETFVYRKHVENCLPQQIPFFSIVSPNFLADIEFTARPCPMTSRHKSGTPVSTTTQLRCFNL